MAKTFEPGASSIAARIDSLEKLRGRGIRTFAFVGPLLPGDPERLAGLLQGRADRVLIDRMNYIETLSRFYSTSNLQAAMTEKFFRDHKLRLMAALSKKKIPFQALF
jgi:DNA repair photolyase